MRILINHWLILIIIVNVVSTNTMAQSRDDERHQPNIDIEMLVDETVNGNRFAAYRINKTDIASAYVIADDSGLDAEYAKRLASLAERYEYIVGEVAPYNLITAEADYHYQKLMMGDWEYVGIGNVQYNDTCNSDGKPDWPKELVDCVDFEPLPEPKPPVGKDPIPPQPEPPADGKPIIAFCFSNPEWILDIIVMIYFVEYDCTNYQGFFDIYDWSTKLSYYHKIKSGALTLTLRYFSKGNWHGIKAQHFYPTEENNDHFSFYHDYWGGNQGQIRTNGIPSPFALYDWSLRLSKIGYIPYPSICDVALDFEHEDCS